MAKTPQYWQKHWLISGIVQGVGFRAATRRTAAGLGITGWVRNTADGAVECLAEGELSRLTTLFQWCSEGPPHAVVREVKLVSERSIESLSFRNFEIRHSR